MRHGGTTRVAAAAVVLLSLLVLEATAFSSMHSADTPRTIAVDLIHVHHAESPYMQGQRNLTLMERGQLLLANDRRRISQIRTSSRGGRRNDLDALSTLVFTSPLAYAGGNYIMQITVGTPARTFVAYADTGSDLAWLQCSHSTCADTNCVQIPDLPFDPSKSSSYSPLPCNSAFCADLTSNLAELPCPWTNICTYNYSYADGTFTFGELASETFTFTRPGGSTIPVRDIAFGCGTDDESTTFQQTDGLVGLGRNGLSLISQLAARSIISHVFSYCLVDVYSTPTQSSPLLLGSSGAAAKSYTPLLTNNVVPSLYYVNLVGITVNGQPISYPPGLFALNETTGAGGIVIDSGTHYTVLFDAALSPLESAISALITYPQANSSGTDFNLCYNTIGVSSPVFPTVVFQFENVDVTLGIDNTFLAITGDTYCLTFVSGGDPTEGPSIYGNIIQSHFEISFDIGNQRVGFGPDAC